MIARHTNLFGTRVDAIVHGGRTRSGRYFSQSLQKPFLSAFGDRAFRQVIARRDDYFGYALPPELGFSPAYLRYRAELWELAYQARLGRPTGRRAILGVGISGESFDAPFGAEGARAVVDGIFSESAVASDAVRAELSRQASPYATKRLSLFLGLRDARFDARRGVDAIQAPQDLFIGSDLTLTLAPGFSISPGDRSDLLTRLKGRFGFMGDRTYLLTRLDVHARRAAGDGPEPDGWRDIVGSLRTDAYWTQRDWASLYLRAGMSGGWRTERPFQLRLGGREAIRAYDEDAFPGGRLLFVSAEQRLTLDRLSPSFADLGAALFADAGRMWAGDAPFGRTSGWESGIGVGLRASPAGARQVFRVDALLPLTHQRHARGVVLRVYAEIFGVIERRRWPSQVDRSRWYGNDLDLSARIPDPLAGN